MKDGDAPFLLFKYSDSRLRLSRRQSHLAIRGTQKTLPVQFYFLLFSTPQPFLHLGSSSTSFDPSSRIFSLNSPLVIRDFPTLTSSALELSLTSPVGQLALVQTTLGFKGNFPSTFYLFFATIKNYLRSRTQSACFC